MLHYTTSLPWHYEENTRAFQKDFHDTIAKVCPYTYHKKCKWDSSDIIYLFIIFGVVFLNSTQGTASALICVPSLADVPAKYSNDPSNLRIGRYTKI